MPKINVLDKHTAELIAAGEVVERPSSVVKELCENSIDAGASSVTVEIADGGINYIRITDNGCGIERGDVRNAFLRHATSKVCTENDLDSIATLGFRGEALASVCAVAKVDLITRTEDEESGTHYAVNGGEEQFLDDAGCPVGTTITIKELFYNTPARMKFLKKNVTEANSVAAVIDRMALSHPEVAVRFIREGKTVLTTPGDGKLMSAVRAVSGREFASSLIYAESECDGIKVTGYISKPSSSRPTRAMQSFFVNGRFVKTVTASQALLNAYKNSIMSGKFPACVLHLEIPYEMVDANVHPAKIEVRFTDERKVFNAVYFAAKSALAGGDTRPVAELPSNNRISQPVKKIYDNAAYPVKPSPYKTAPPSETYTPVKFDDVVNTVPVLRDGTDGYYYPSEKAKPVTDDNKIPTGFGIKAPDITVDDEPVKNNEPQRPVTAGKPLPAADENVNETVQGEKINPDSVKIIGEAFNTYIIAQIDSRLLLIDKHAAHERIIFNRLIKTKTAPEAQMLLSPVTVTLQKKQYDAVVNSSSELEKAGIIIDDFGAGTVAVRAVPMLSQNEDIASFTEEIAEKLIDNPSDLLSGHTDWLYHSVACRAAVKAGDRSDISEITALAREVAADDSIRYCPHGRPVAVWLTRHELEKQFKRIV